MQPLLLSRDPALLDEVARLAAAAGASPQVVGRPLAALPSWASAPVVLVGADLVEEVAGAAPPPRSGVHVVGWSAPDGVFRAALAIGADAVVELPDDAERLVELLTDVGESPARGEVIGVVGGAGGVGATTLACALAQVGAWSGPALVLDTDQLGPGVDQLLGLESVAGVRWDDLSGSAGRLGSRSLREAVPSRAGLGVLTWRGARADPPEPALLREALSAARRGHELVVVDLARHGGERTVELAARCDRLLVVTPATVAGAAATARLLGLLGDGAGRGLVVRDGTVGWADLERATGVPVVGTAPRQRGLAEAFDLGLGPVRHRRVPLARAARSLLAAP